MRKPHLVVVVVDLTKLVIDCPTSPEELLLEIIS